MKTRNNALDQQAINTFALEKVLTLTELSKILQCSPITVHRRLKEWDAYTSYNKNGRYYTIGAIPEFNRNGIWQYKDMYFSRYGTLKNTVIALTIKSKKGLNHAELQEIIGLNPKCFMARFKNLPGIKRERYKNTIIYFSDTTEKYEAQKRNRFPPEPAAAALPPDAQAIIMLVELIHNPGMSSEELTVQLEKKGNTIDSGSVAALFKKYRIDKKKLNTRW
ncbi:MAG: hypothetical protein HQ557_01310 [Bacteroidetes bacterium]|nr:hypothetical protein [Bacteroidota bacterium]